MSKLLKHPIISSVVAGIVLAMLGFIWTDHSQIIAIVSSLASLTKETLVYKLKIPVWCVAIFVLVVYGFVRFSSKKTARALQENHKEKKIEPLKLSELENIILSMHVGLEEDYGIVASEVAEKNSLHVEEAKVHLEELERKGYIAFSFYADNSENAYRLSSAGRRYVVQNNLL